MSELDVAAEFSETLHTLRVQTLQPEWDSDQGKVFDFGSKLDRMTPLTLLINFGSGLEVDRVGRQAHQDVHFYQVERRMFSLESHFWPE